LVAVNFYEKRHEVLLISVKEAVLAALKELVLPELALLKQDQGEIKKLWLWSISAWKLEANNQRLDDVNRRLDDANTHLIDQTRRIDAVREELSGRIFETNKRLDRFYEVLVRREEHQQLAAR
jgi:hypothetical protein